MSSLDTFTYESDSSPFFFPRTLPPLPPLPDDLRRLLGVRRSARTTTVNIGSQIVNLLTVFVSNFSAACGTRVGTQDDAILKNDACNSGAGLHCLRECRGGKKRGRVGREG